MIDIERLCDFPDWLASQFPEKQDFLTDSSLDKPQIYSVVEYCQIIKNLAIGFIEQGISAGDKVVTITNNRPEWNFADIALSTIGAIHVPIYSNISRDNYLHIFSHSEAKLLFIGNAEIYEHIRPVIQKVTSLKGVFSFDEIETITNWNELLKQGKATQEKHQLEYEKRKNAVKPDDFVSLIYTSGTTGTPKGVMLSHRNFICQVKAAAKLFHFGVNDKVLSFLPLCHVLERMVNYYYHYAGCSIHYVRSTKTLSADLKRVRPVIFVTVPRLLEKIYGKLIARGKNLKGIARRIFFWAVETGFNYEPHKQMNFFQKLRHSFLDKTIYSKWREALGGKTGLIISGGAALQPRLCKLFCAAGIPIREGYGLTETAPVVCVNPQDNREMRAGTVGSVLSDEMEIKIADDGEILFRGPNLMLGYYRNEHLTNQVIDENGWFHTGDIGDIVEKKFLKITDRKKEIFKLSTGFFVAPIHVENTIKESFFIEEVFVFGEGQKFAAAVIVPNKDFLYDWCKLHNIAVKTDTELVANTQVIERIQLEVDKLNSKLNRSEQIKKFVLDAGTWSTETGELSPTLKLQRKRLESKYASVITSLF